MNQTPHLSPIEHPTDPQAQATFERWQAMFGKVSTVAKVIYARAPQLAALAGHINETHETLSLEPELCLLVQMKASQLNDCAFCQDLTLARALQSSIGAERFRDLENFRDSDAYSPREKAALAFVEEATRDRKVHSATWQQVKIQFSETEIVELTWLNAAENYFNLQTGVLGIESDNLAQSVKTPHEQKTTNE